MRTGTVFPFTHLHYGNATGFLNRFTLWCALLLFFSAACPLPGHARSPLNYKVKRGDTLIDIAGRYEVSVMQLRLWNVLRDDNIIEGQRLRLWPRGPLPRYVVRSGETLSEISAQFDIPISALRSLNDISGDRIYPGERLKLQALPRETNGAETYEVVKCDTLWRIATNYGLSVSELQALNELEGTGIRPGDILVVQDAPEDAPEDAEQFEYVVRKGDTLSEIAQRNKVSTGLIRQLNRLVGDRISPGDVLQLQPSSLEEATHIVLEGETLSGIALKYHITVADLEKINGLESSMIQVGQELRLKEASSQVHLVDRGDALWEIAASYGMTVNEIKALNGLTSDVIYPGQELRLGSRTPAYQGSYRVKSGDSLAGIARLHQMSVAEIKSVNSLQTSVIHPGDTLRVRPLLDREEDGPETTIADPADLSTSSADIKKLSVQNGPYYFRRPVAERQIRPDYYEGPVGEPLNNYRRAQRLWADFEDEGSHLPRISSALAGWHFVLDPGHGGLDPGTIVKSLDGSGRAVYVVEDEYVYDVALRVYVLLRRYGAEATMTVLSPNHLIRHSEPPRMTFVNEKNEVYNSYKLNRKNKWYCWPSGGADGNLHNRVTIARDAFRGVPKRRRIFLSFHADIEPAAPEAALAMYYKSKTREDLRSKRFAEILLPALGAGAHIRGRSLGVLRDNPADVSLLIEIRNLAYIDHAWALRYEELRQRDAEKIVKGLLDYVGDSITTVSR